MKASKRDIAVGDRILVTVEPAPPGRAPHDPPLPTITEVVTVDAITVMHCGCTRAGFDRPHSDGGSCPRVHVFSDGCRWSADHVDFAAAREAAQLYDLKAASPPIAASLTAQGCLFEVGA